MAYISITVEGGMFPPYLLDRIAEHRPVLVRLLREIQEPDGPALPQRLPAGADLLWSQEQLGRIETAEYERDLCWFRVLLGLYELRPPSERERRGPDQSFARGGTPCHFRGSEGPLEGPPDAPPCGPRWCATVY